MLLEATKNGGNIPPDLLENLLKGLGGGNSGAFGNNSGVSTNGNTERGRKPPDPQQYDNNQLQQGNASPSKQSKGNNNTNNNNNNNNNKKKGGNNNDDNNGNTKMENELRAKEENLAAERGKREQLEAMVREMEQKMVVGGVGGDEESKKKFKEMQAKLKKEKKKQEALIAESAKKEEEMMFYEKQYQTLQEEVEEQRKLLQRLRKKYKEVCTDLEDIEREFEHEKEDLLDTIRGQDKDVKLYTGIAKFLLTNEEIERIKDKSKWDENKNDWIIPGFILRGRKVKFPKLGGKQASELAAQEKEMRELAWGERDDDDNGGGDHDDNDGPIDVAVGSYKISKKEANKASTVMLGGAVGIRREGYSTNPGKVGASESNFMMVNANYGTSYKPSNYSNVHEGYGSVDERQSYKLVPRPNMKNVLLEPLNNNPTYISVNDKSDRYPQTNPNNTIMSSQFPTGISPTKPPRVLKPLGGSGTKNIEVTFKASVRIDNNNNNMDSEANSGDNNDMDDYNSANRMAPDPVKYSKKVKQS